MVEALRRVAVVSKRVKLLEREALVKTPQLTKMQGACDAAVSVSNGRPREAQAFNARIRMNWICSSVDNRRITTQK